MLYNAAGNIRVNVVTGTVYTGLYAPDGAYNVVINTTPNVMKGLYHPCGGYNVMMATGTEATSQASNGSYFIKTDGVNYTLFKPTQVVGVVMPVLMPIINSISPNMGSLMGGLAITISGSNFTGATSVTVGGVAATMVMVVNDTTIMAVTPMGTAGSKSVQVITPSGTNASNTLFTYTAQPTYVTETTQSLPAMTNSVTPTGHVITSSSYYDGDTQPFYAFDKNAGSRWASGGDVNPWIQRQHPTAIRLGAYRITAGYPGQTANMHVLQGSNNGSTWTNLDSRSDLTWSFPETKEFVIPSGVRATYLYHRVVFTTTQYQGVYELELLQDIAQ